MKTVGRSLGESALKCAGRMLSPEARRWIRATVCPNTLWPFRNFLVSTRYRFVYCWIPKVGCTTVKTCARGTLAEVPAGELRGRRGEFSHLELMTPALAELIGKRYACDAQAFGYGCPEEFVA